MNEEIPEDKMRTAQEIASRALIVSVVTAVAYGDPRDEVSQWLQTEGLWADVSPTERAFLETSAPEEKAIIFFSWGVERLVPLLWSIQKLPELQPLTCKCDTTAVQGAIVWPPASTGDFIRCAQMRPVAQIAEEYEKVYHSHWRVRDAQINGRPIPEELNAGVVYERHYAFNWIIGYFGQAWDDISTDT
jgi:hypothetical protein